jgi:hypothetical protein
MNNGFTGRNWIVFPGVVLAIALPLGAQTTVTLSPATLAFGNQVEGTTSAAKTATLQNAKSGALTITSIAVTGEFTKASTTCPLSPAKLAAGASCTIRITFQPLTLGSFSGTLTVTDSAANSPQTASLTGKGVAPVTVSPASLSFAGTPVGETTAAQTVTLTNNETTAVTFSSIAATGNFAVTGNTCSPSIGPAPATCTVGVTFTPTATGARKGQLTFTDSATNSPQSVSLAGTGTAAVLVSIAVTPVNPSMFVNGTLQLTATGTYSNNTTKNLSSTVVWTTSPLAIASLTTSGLATGLAAGSTTVTAALGAITNNTTLTVVQVYVPTGSLNTARYYHTATLLDTAMVLVAGGIGPIPGGTGAMGDLNSAELYNPVSGTFSPTGNLKQARSEHSATLLNNGWVLIAGGSGGDGALASAELYNPSTAAFSPSNPLNTARYEHTATLLPGGEVLIAGGYGSAGVLSSAEIFNASNATFTPTGSLTYARFDATATPLPNGMVLIAGGADANGPLSTAELYDPTAGTFTPTTGPLNTARSGALATLLNTGLVLVASGYNYEVTGPLTSAELYDPTAGSFTDTGSLSRTAYLGTATLLTNGTVLAAGSIVNATGSEVYFPITGTFSITGEMTTPRDLQTATLLPAGAVLMAGGYSSATNAVLAAAELYESGGLVPLNLVSIAVTPLNSSLAVGSSQQLVATGTFSDTSTQQLASVVWTSSNPAAAIVTDDITNSGVAFGVAAGVSNISACTGAVCGTTMLTVTGAPKH